MNKENFQNFNKNDFGAGFKWGVSTAAYQIEGGWNEDGKGISIWDKFCETKGKIYNNQSGKLTCDFYHRWKEDLQLMKEMNIPNFRFSISWTRLFPEGNGKINPAGISFYNQIIDYCLFLGIEPWVTLYHWDLPLALEESGGWTNRDIVSWFGDYVEACIVHFGDRVNYWMVLNEPMVFTGAGYFLGVHAPGKKGLRYFLPAVHHAALCQAEGARRIKSLRPGAEVGTTFSCSYIEPLMDTTRDRAAAERVDAVLNRLFIEPSLGLGYPTDKFDYLKRIEKYMQPGDQEKLKFDFDFIGVQNYTREIVKYSLFTPVLKANLVKANKRGGPITLMDWEVYPEAIYWMLKKFNNYPGVKKIYITENGAAFEDNLNGGKVEDPKRVEFLTSYLSQVLRAKKEGIKVEGYFIWTFTDNFEWAEGFRPRFGLVHVDFETQKRIIKSSGFWYNKFLEV
ncbi:GH1 family beta-glucosidase [soil metagenome]